MGWICLAVTLCKQSSFRESQERAVWPVWCVSSPACTTLWIPHHKPQTNKIKRYYWTKQRTSQKGKLCYFAFLLPYFSRPPITLHIPKSCFQHRQTSCLATKEFYFRYHILPTQLLSRQCCPTPSSKGMWQVLWAMVFHYFEFQGQYINFSGYAHKYGRNARWMAADWLFLTTWLWSSSC